MKQWKKSATNINILGKECTKPKMSTLLTQSAEVGNGWTHEEILKIPPVFVIMVNLPTAKVRLRFTKYDKLCAKYVMEEHDHIRYIF